MNIHVHDTTVTLLTVDDVLDANECARLVEVADRIGFSSAPVTTYGGFVMMPDVRNNTRVIVDDAGLAARLWERIAPAVPQTLRRWTAVGQNERFRYYRYDAGQRFAWHRDGTYERGHHEASMLTLIFYLNEGFDGGATEFSDPPRRVKPSRGGAVLFDHGLRHQGAPVTAGRKDVLRTDVMYRFSRPPEAPPRTCCPATAHSLA